MDWQPAAAWFQMASADFVDSSPLQLWILLLGSPLDFYPIPVPFTFDMTGMAQLPNIQLVCVTSPTDTDEVPIVAPETPGAYGLTIALQIATLDIVTSTGRLGSVRHLLLLPKDGGRNRTCEFCVRRV